MTCVAIRQEGCGGEKMKDVDRAAEPFLAPAPDGATASIRHMRSQIPPIDKSFPRNHMKNGVSGLSRRAATRRYGRPMQMCIDPPPIG